MDLIFSKKNIKNLKLSEGKDYKIFKKSDLKLNEDNEFVGGKGASEVASNISNKFGKGAKNITANGDSFTDSKSDDSVGVSVTGKTPYEIAQNGKEEVKKLQSHGISPSNVTVTAQNVTRQLESLRRNSVPFSKKELNEILKK